MQSPHKRILWVDILRIIGVLLVIAMHGVDVIVYHWGKAPLRNNATMSWWLTGVTYKAVASICVPILFMLSGYLLLSSRNTILQFFERRMIKILIPLFIWSALYLWWDGAFVGNPTITKSVKLIIRSVLEGPVYFHLWFLYSLLGLYLVTPIIRGFVQSASETEILYALGLWIFATVAFTLLQQLKGIDVALFRQPYLTGFLGYYLAGYYLGKKEYSNKQIWIATVLFVLMVAGKTLWAYHLTADGGKFDTNLFEYLTWHVIVTSLAGFIVLKNAATFLEKWLPAAVQKAIVVVSGTMFGIYLVHPKILSLLDNNILGFRIGADIFHPLLAVPYTVLIVFLLSFALVFLIQKIPVFKAIVP